MHPMQKRNVATVLKSLLDRHGLSPTELHRRTGVPQSTLSRILGEKIADPSDKHVSKIAEYFGVSTDQLRGRVDLGDSREAERVPGHDELRDISLWDDETPSRTTRSRFLFFVRSSWQQDQDDSSSRKASGPACGSASAACATTVCSSIRPNA